MPITREDRRDYERGVRDRNRPVIDQVLHDLTANHPGTPAYYRARRGERLDRDQKGRRSS